MENLFTLNHDGETLEEIMGVTVEQIKLEVQNDVLGDIPFGAAMLKVFANRPSVGVVVSAVLSGVLDRNLDLNSEVVEYLVRTVSRDRREYIMDALEYAMTNGEHNPLSELEKMLRKFAEEK